MKPAYTTQAQVRAAFWEQASYARKPGLSQNDYPTDVRVSFVDFVDQLCREGHITEALAQRVTL